MTDIDPDEALASQLWSVHRRESGLDAIDWIGDLSPVQAAAWVWVNMDPYKRDIWIEVAKVARKMVSNQMAQQ